MQTKEITQIIEDFVDVYYPKGDDNRGFALTVLALFLLNLNTQNSAYKIIKNVDV